MTKKKRYTLKEVNLMYKLKYPYGNVEIERIKLTSVRFGYRIGCYGQYFKTLREVVDKLKLER